MQGPSQSNSWLSKRWEDMTEGVPLFLLISFLCSLILVVRRLFVWPTYDASQFLQLILYTTPIWLKLSILSFPVFINIFRVLGMVKAMGHPSFDEIVFKELEMCFMNGTVKYVMWGSSKICCWVGLFWDFWENFLILLWMLANINSSG